MTLGCACGPLDMVGVVAGYLGREDASLLTMVSDFMNEADGHSEGMLMHNHTALKEQILSWSRLHSAFGAFGVTWAILDWMEELQKRTNGSTRFLGRGDVGETGGMKGRGIEPIREEVHAEIRQRLPEIQIASEYGMTEMMSQGYAQDGVHHRFPKWVRPVVREPRDPRSPGLKDRVDGWTSWIWPMCTAVHFWPRAMRPTTQTMALCCWADKTNRRFAVAVCWRRREFIT